MSTVRKGDIVTVRAKVVGGSEIAGAGSIYVDLGYHYTGTSVSLDRVALVEPHFEVGDTVSIVDGSVTGTVRAAIPGHVWVEHSNGTFATYLASDLRLVGGPADPVAIDPALIETPPSMAIHAEGEGNAVPEF